MIPRFPHTVRTYIIATIISTYFKPSANDHDDALKTINKIIEDPKSMYAIANYDRVYSKPFGVFAMFPFLAVSVMLWILTIPNMDIASMVVASIFSIISIVTLLGSFKSALFVRRVHRTVKDYRDVASRSMDESLQVLAEQIIEDLKKEIAQRRAKAYRYPTDEEKIEARLRRRYAQKD